MKKDNKNSTKVDVNKILNRIVKFLKKLGVLLKKGTIALIAKLKEISKTRYGKIDGNYVLIGGILVIVLFIMFIGNFINGDKVDYPVDYNNTDGELQLITKKAKNEDDAIKIASSERPEDIVYAKNTTINGTI
jgi:hypothetical protein